MAVLVFIRNENMESIFLILVDFFDFFILFFCFQGIFWRLCGLGKWHNGNPETKIIRDKWHPRTCPSSEVNLHSYFLFLLYWLLIFTGSPQHRHLFFVVIFVLRGTYSISDTLKKCGISEGSTIFFSLSSFSKETPYDDMFYFNDVVPSVSQTLMGISVFFSSLYAIVSTVLLVSFIHLMLFRLTVKEASFVACSHKSFSFSF